MNHCGFNIEPFCSDMCGDHRRPQTLAEICRNMDSRCGFRAVAAREKYPGLTLLGLATPAQAWWTAHFFFNFMQTAQPGEKLKVMGKVKGESQSMGPTFSWLIPSVPCQSGIPFLSYGFFAIWTCKSKVKVKWPQYCTTTGPDNSTELQMV